MHRYNDENGLQMVFDLDDRDRLAGRRAVAALMTVGLGAVAWVIAAGVYEFTPLKQHFRRRCSADKSLRSGVEFGLYCVGSSIGLMLVQAVLGGMSVSWMSVVGILMLAQKVLPAKAVSMCRLRLRSSVSES